MSAHSENEDLVQFGVLGPLRVVAGEEIIAFPAKRRVLLAALLLRANRVVPVSTLIDAMWDDTPPPSARNTLQGHVMRLRALLGEARIITRAAGYLVVVAADELDLERFTGLCEQGSAAAAAGDWRGAAALLNEALAQWRGDPLADVPSAALRRAEVPRLTELRLAAVESRIAADLQLGRHADLVAELRQLTATDPLREGLRGQLMLALYRCGRRAEALAVFRDIDRLLRDELGIGPGPGLAGLHQRILSADPALEQVLSAGREPAPARGPGPGPGPAQLPPDAADFTGRGEQVKLLGDLLAARPDAERPGAVVIATVAGMGGIGKTALAVHTAHRLRDRFPDGQLFVSLQGAGSPLRPAEVLARFLRDLGVPDTEIPVTEAERTSRYRSLLADRSVLVVLDDARDAAQVRPLLPASASCAVLVTSRSTLPGLASAALLGLGALDAAEARDLFHAIVGHVRAEAEPEATGRVLAYCAGLPLAIRIAANRLASRPGWSIAHLAAKLAGERGRLVELTAGDVAVRASFAVSYGALPVPLSPGDLDPARVFRLLGLPAATVLSLPAITALAGRPSAEVAGALEILTDAHLIESPAPDRFRLHDLLRCYAAELAGHTDDEGERTAALARMLRWYSAQAVAATRALAPDRGFPVIVPVPATAVPPASPGEALDWYETEHCNLVDAARRAADCGLPDVATQIAIAMWEYFQRMPHVEDRLVISQIGVVSAQRLGDDAVLARMLNGLGQAHSEHGNFTEANRYLTEALQIRRRSGDSSGEAKVLNSLALDRCNQGRFGESLGYLRSAQAIHTALGDKTNVGITLNNIGHVLQHLNRHDEALDCLSRALTILEQTGDRFWSSKAEGALGDTHRGLGRFDDAVQHYRRALALLEDTARAHLDQADVLYGLGLALTALGRARDARDAWQAAAPILDGLGDDRAPEVRERLARLPRDPAAGATVPARSPCPAGRCSDGD